MIHGSMTSLLSHVAMGPKLTFLYPMTLQLCRFGMQVQICRITLVKYPCIVKGREGCCSLIQTKACNVTWIEDYYRHIHGLLLPGIYLKD